MCAIEAVRGCGHRVVNGLYLIGAGVPVVCDRLPLPVTVCPVCGEGLRATRGPKKIDAQRLWGEHSPCTEDASMAGCYVCHPRTGASYIIGVGEKSYPMPEDFCEEAVRLGVSKRISAVPKDIALGKTVVFLTHKKGLYLGKNAQEEDVYQTAVIWAFVVTRLEMLVRESQLEEKRKDLEKRGITPVPVPDNDPDHIPGLKQKKEKVEKEPGVKKHYHLVAGTAGLQPERYPTKAEAQEALSSKVKAGRESWTTLKGIRGSAQKGFTVVCQQFGEPETAERYFVTSCQAPDCSPILGEV